MLPLGADIGVGHEIVAREHAQTQTNDATAEHVRLEDERVLAHRVPRRHQQCVRHLHIDLTRYSVR